MKALFTIVAKNYMASAISLMKSVKRYHNDLDLYIILADEEIDKCCTYGFNIISAKELAIDAYDKMAFMYDVVEFSTSIKPFAILYFLQKRGYDKVIYLDPDTWVMESMESIFEQLDKFECVLTPHIVDMDIVSNIRKESHILNRGIYNLGFIGVNKSDSIMNFLAWWADRLKTECIRSDVLFTDQKWIDYLPIFVVNYCVLKDKKYNIADWNFQERCIKKIENEFCVLEKDNKYAKIVFMHFSGVKQQSPDEYFNKICYAKPTDERKAVEELVSIYQKELLINDYDFWSVQPYSYNYFANGTPIAIIHRRIYRHFVLEGKESKKSPFAVDKDTYYRYLRRNRLIKEKRNKVLQSNATSRVNSIPKEKVLLYKIFAMLIQVFLLLFGVEKYDKFITILRDCIDVDNQYKWFED